MPSHILRAECSIFKFHQSQLPASASCLSLAPAAALLSGPRSDMYLPIPFHHDALTPRTGFPIHLAVKYVVTLPTQGAVAGKIAHWPIFDNCNAV